MVSVVELRFCCIFCCCGASAFPVFVEQEFWALLPKGGGEVASTEVLVWIFHPSGAVVPSSIYRSRCVSPMYTVNLECWYLG